MMISPIQSQIWQDTLPKDKSSLIDNCTINKFIHQSTSCLHCPDWWRKPSKRTEKITLQFPTNCMPIMPPRRIPQPWRPLSVKKPWLKKITPISSSWKDSRKSSSPKVNTSQEVCMTHWTWPGNCYQFILKKVCQRSQPTSLKSITRRDLMRMKRMRRESE